MVVVVDPFHVQRTADGAGDDLYGLGPGEVGRAVDGLDAAAGLGGGQQSGDGDFGDVTWRDPGHRLVERQDDRNGASADCLNLQQQVGEEEPTSQMGYVNADVVEGELGGGKASISPAPCRFSAPTRLWNTTRATEFSMTAVVTARVARWWSPSGSSLSVVGSTRTGSRCRGCPRRWPRCRTGR
jgi:hypothetical protein